MTVGTEKRDAVASLHARFAQRSGKPRDALGELSVCEAFLSTDDGDALRILLLRVTKEADWRQWNIHGLSNRLRLSVLHQPPVHVLLHNWKRPKPGRLPLLSNRHHRRTDPMEHVSETHPGFFR